MKDKLFQYYNGIKIVEDTDLITTEEAISLWERHIKECKTNLKEGFDVQMCIWTNCVNTTDYSAVLKEIDYRDCVVENDRVFKITKEEIK